ATTAVVDVAGRKAMTAVVAREEDDRQARDLADAQRRRRLAPRACDARLAHVLKPGQVVDARAADHAEHRLGHDGFPYALKIASALDSASSCPAKAGHPVNITVAVLSWTSVITGSPAFAGDDERWV